jgi:hypothetical protein
MLAEDSESHVSFPEDSSEHRRSGTLIAKIEEESQPSNGASCLFISVSDVTCRMLFTSSCAAPIEFNMKESVGDVKLPFLIGDLAVKSIPRGNMEGWNLLINASLLDGLSQVSFTNRNYKGSQGISVVAAVEKSKLETPVWPSVV